MRTPRVSVPACVRAGDTVEVPLEEGLHLASVLRRAPGDPVILVPESGGAFHAVIARIEGSGRATRVTVAVTGAAGGGPPITPWAAAVAVARGDAFEIAVRMAAELGLEAVIPIVTERTAVRIRGTGKMGGTTGKEERWRRIAREAAKQCGREAPLLVPATRTLAALVGAWSLDPSLPADFPGGPPRRGWALVPGESFRLEALRGAEGGAPASAVFLVGPEGGLTPGEVARASAAGFEPLGFPTPVLRTPTAVALLGALGVLAAAAR